MIGRLGMFGGHQVDEVDEAIVAAVFELMATTDIPKIKVADVIKRAGISRSTFYRHFDSVDDVVKQFEDDILDSMSFINKQALNLRFSQVELDPTPAMVERMTTLRNHRDQVLALNGPHGDPAFIHKATVFMHDYLRERLASLYDGSDPNFMDLYLAFVIAGHHNLIQYWLEIRPELEPRYVAAVLNRVYYSAFFLDGSSVQRKASIPELD